MSVESLCVEREIKIGEVTEQIVDLRTELDLEEARQPLVEGETEGSSPCSNSGNGCTGSCNHSSK